MRHRQERRGRRTRTQQGPGRFGSQRPRRGRGHTRRMQAFGDHRPVRMRPVLQLRALPHVRGGYKVGEGGQGGLRRHGPRGGGVRRIHGQGHVRRHEEREGPGPVQADAYTRAPGSVRGVPQKRRPDVPMASHDRSLLGHGGPMSQFYTNNACNQWVPICGSRGRRSSLSPR